MSQQTLKMHINHIQPNEIKENPDDFSPTNFDVMVDEYMEACMEDEEIPYMKQVFPAGEFIFCIIDTRPMNAAEKEAYQKMKAEKSGIVTSVKNIKDIDFKM